MKVIENNSHKSGFPRRITCKQVFDENGYSYGNELDFCGSVLEVEASDIKKHHWEKYYESGESYIVVCPICGSWIEIDSNTLSSTTKAEAEEIQRGRR